MNAIEHPIDLREIPGRQRHSIIFNTWNELPTGGAILLLNDHDPLPLYDQFATEYGGGFRWEYLQSGPAVWEVRINKGEFVDAGFYPTKKQDADGCVKSQPIKFMKPLILDTRPLFAKGQAPCDAIDNAVAKLIPGQRLVLLVPFEPVPLYAKLRQQGFSHKPAQFENDVWRVEFKK